MRLSRNINISGRILVTGENREREERQAERGKIAVNIISVYAPQLGCEKDEKGVLEQSEIITLVHPK